MTETPSLTKLQQYYRQRGYLVVGCNYPLSPGTIGPAKWLQDEMKAYRWSVISECSREDYVQESSFTGIPFSGLDPEFRFFYRVVALD